MTTPTTTNETRHLPRSELRAKVSDTGVTIEGYAAKFGVMSEDLGGFREVIEPGTFSRAISEPQDVRMLGVSHDTRTVFARTKAGTLTLEEDTVGLRFEAKLPDTQAARDLAKSIERGDIDGMSFGFRTVRDRWEFLQGGEIRHLEDVDLLDVSPVVFPAYPDTSVAKRCLASRNEDRVRAAKLRARQLRQMEAEAV